MTAVCSTKLPRPCPDRVTPTMGQAGDEVDAVAGLQRMPEAAELDIELALQHHHPIFSLVRKRRAALGPRRSREPQKRRFAAHVGRQQLVADVGAWKQEALALLPPHYADRCGRAQVAVKARICWKRVSGTACLIE